MKVGKTSFAAKLEKNLFLATEIGTNALAGLYVQKIQTWSDFKRVLAELKKPQASELYETITIDTIKLLWDLCEKYICQQNDVSSIADIPWGRNLPTSKAIY